MTYTDLEQLITNVIGKSPVSVRRLTFGHSNEVYDVALGDKNVIVRLNADPKMLVGTERHLSTFAELGFPVPQPLYSDLSLEKYPVAFVILEKLPGRDLRDELPLMTKVQMTKLAKTITRFQRQVTDLPRGQGFGWTHLGQRAAHETWLEVVQGDLDKTTDAAHQKGYSAAWTAINQHLQHHVTYLETMPATCFLDDLTTKNVLVERGELTGLIDFDWVCYGDPLYWLALTQTATSSDVGVKGQFYMSELKRLWNVSSEQAHVIDFYAAVHALKFLGREQRETRRERLLDAINKWLSSDL